MPARAAQRAVSRADAGEAAARTDGPTLGTTGEHAADTAEAAGETPPIAVVGSGNLGGVWFTDAEAPLDRDRLEARHPDLLQALRTHPSIGFVVVRTPDGPLALGAHGSRELHTGVVTGDDPLVGYPAHTAADFARASAFEDAPDIYVNSAYDATADEVAAFEELVGCHGGVGGWQTRPLLVHPADWSVGRDLVDGSGRLFGAEAVHRQLVRWLEELGHRESLRAQPDEGGAAGDG